ncbi:mannose-1-phosphate guanylyltransferase/mannose-6-phosphate isomerase [Burkholderia guangdongensis]|uniref:mannose-1-phosphate guanylyltransferase/mannose-6-phosphate isomerase n=1 Tax=Burkholderia guangdongensis TaxID=1792500 RepID=UPI001FEC425D|nr:mannose-1-phosphate guanylyltransferase/mannose-6-phosphate isomerase [Burkholderia guangdongensis]
MMDTTVGHADHLPRILDGRIAAGISAMPDWAPDVVLDATPDAMPDMALAATPDAAPDVAPDILPVVLAGGSGTRLWPLSREAYPKQLLGLLGERSLLEQAVTRLDRAGTNAANTANTANTTNAANRGLMVCAAGHQYLAAEQSKASARKWQIIVEPVSRNTAPALTLAALAASADGRDPVLVITPADHAISDTLAFERAIAAAARLAHAGHVVTLGVVATRAECGYGYIEIGEPIDSERASGARTVARFVEKPDRATANAFLNGQRHWWNSGIFVMRASVWLRAIDTLRADIGRACRAALDNYHADQDIWNVAADTFACCPSDSIDYAVIERLAEGGLSGAVVPLDAGWSDVGSWDAVWDAMPKDAQGNVTRGDTLLENASGMYVHSEGRLVACVGTNDLVVVETADAVLVAHKEHAQQVKALVARMQERERSERTHHRKVFRPWGYYDSIDRGSRFQVKRIVVAPGAALSLQLHYHRAEHWIVVRGTAQVTRGDETFLLTENQSTYVPVGIKHRLENVGRLPLELIEVQCGDYLGEDDIVRFNDRYARQTVGECEPKSRNNGGI